MLFMCNEFTYHPKSHTYVRTSIVAAIQQYICTYVCRLKISPTNQLWSVYTGMYVGTYVPVLSLSDRSSWH